MNLPNKLTAARCVMAVIFVGLMSFEDFFCYVLAYLVFTVAAITDYFDGKIARERNLITNFGRLFDPIADKVLMVAGFVMLLKIPAIAIPGWCIVVILAREFLVTGARALAAAEGIIIEANKWGKTKTVLQMVYIFTFLFFAILFEAFDRFPIPRGTLPIELADLKTYIGHASTYAIVLIALYTVYSGIQYARLNWKTLRLDC